MEKEKEVDFRRFPKTDLYHYLIDLLFEYPQNNKRIIEVIKRIIEINHKIRDDKYCRILKLKEWYGLEIFRMIKEVGTMTRAEILKEFFKKTVLTVVIAYLLFTWGKILFLKSSRSGACGYCRRRRGAATFPAGASNTTVSTGFLN